MKPRKSTRVAEVGRKWISRATADERYIRMWALLPVGQSSSSMLSARTRKRVMRAHNIVLQYGARWPTPVAILVS